jgi:Holliday junction DNA helicase RuvA
MISQLTGKLIYRSLPHLVVDVNGIGYEIEATTNTFTDLPALGEEVTIFTHFVVREDAQLLFGFASREERDVFRTLIKISGVGGKLALSILSGLLPAELASVIESEDIAALQRLPGVGKKTAERLIIELRGKLAEFQLTFTGDVNVTVELQGLNSSVSAQTDAVYGLIALGYKPNEAEKMVKAVASSDITDSETIIRSALKSFIRK